MTRRKSAHTQRAYREDIMPFVKSMELGWPDQLNAPACSGLPFLPLFTGQAEDGQALAAARYQDRPEIVLKDIWVLPDHTIHRLSDEENSPCREWCRHKAGQKLDRANPPAMLPAGVRIFRKALNPMSTLVKVQPKGQMTIPRRVRSAVGLVDGDLVEVRAVGKKIVITPQLVIDRTKFPTADDEYTPAQRRIIDAQLAEGLEDIRKGRVSPKFDTVDELLASLKAGHQSQPRQRKNRSR